MRSRLVALALTAALPLMFTAPAQAAPPTKETVPFTDVIEAHVDACDRTLRWDIDGVAEVTTYFDNEGDVVRTKAMITELNTITDVDNGVTLREGPVAFTQTTTFNDDGTETVEINGLSVNVVSGENRVVDVGRLVVLIGPEPEVLHMSGRHDIRGLDPFQLTAHPLHLEGFCAAFA